MRLSEWLEYLQEVEKKQKDPRELAPPAGAVQAPVARKDSDETAPQVPEVRSAADQAAKEVPGERIRQTSTREAGASTVTPPTTNRASAPPGPRTSTQPPDSGTGGRSARAGSLDDLTLRIPEIEDFMPFLRDKDPEVIASPEKKPDVKKQPEHTATSAAEPATEQTAETGPQPASARPASPPMPRTQPGAKQAAATPPAQAQEKQEALTEAQPQPGVDASDLAKLPSHIQSLARMDDSEVAQNSYKRSFRESRSELVKRLLDPPLSLEDAARILNVCPTTVRRYTNRGVLPHFRTAGNQRRFRLSDVIAFMEQQGQRYARGRRRRENANDSASAEG